MQDTTLDSPVADARDPADYTLGDYIDIRRRLRSGEPVTADEHAALAKRRESSERKAATAMLKRLRSPEDAAFESMPPRLQAHYEHRTIASTRRDPLFQSYVRRVTRSARVDWGHRSTRTARPREHRAAASSSSSSQDPGDGSSDEPPPPPLTLWRHPRYGATNPALLRVLLDAERVLA